MISISSVRQESPVLLIRDRRGRQEEFHPWVTFPLNQTKLPSPFSGCPSDTSWEMKAARASPTATAIKTMKNWQSILCIHAEPEEATLQTCQGHNC